MLNYDNHDYNQGYGQLKEAFTALTKDDIFQLYLSDHEVRSSNNGDILGYKLYVFDIQYQRSLESAQPIKVEFKVDGVVAARI